jgi:hypothetical protein
VVINGDSGYEGDQFIVEIYVGKISTMGTFPVRMRIVVKSFRSHHRLDHQFGPRAPSKRSSPHTNRLSDYPTQRRGIPQSSRRSSKSNTGPLERVKQSPSARQIRQELILKTFECGVAESARINCFPTVLPPPSVPGAGSPHRRANNNRSAPNHIAPSSQKPATTAHPQHGRKHHHRQ